MIDGPDARVVSGLDDVKLELMQLNLYLRDLLAVSGRDLPTPVVNVSPPTVVVEASKEAPQALDLSPLLQALSGLARPLPDPSVTNALEALHKEFKDLGVGMRAIAGSAYGSSGGGALHIAREDLDYLAGILAPSDARTLTERMLAKAPKANYALWLDTADPTYIYLAEAPAADVGTAATFSGIRVVKDATGNPLGKVQSALNFAWDSRSAAGWS